MLDRILNTYPSIYKYDKFFTGFLPGIVGPAVGVLLFYLMKSADVSWERYVQLLKAPSFLSPLLSFGCILNLVIFYLFISRNYYNAARGVIAATFIWAIPIVITKFFM